MSKRARYVWLGTIGTISAFLAWSAWHVPRGVDEDNQGGFVVVPLFLLVPLFIYVPALCRSLASWIDLHHVRCRPTRPGPAKPRGILK